jgi:putative Ca2+/H+ antiporter (TMEM165/GDT1 family)
MLTFGLVFLAELGDKTQLTTMMVAAESSSPVSVFLGAVLALTLSTLLGVLLGSFLNQTIPPQYIKTGAGLAFIIIGGLLVFNKL